MSESAYSSEAPTPGQQAAAAATGAAQAPTEGAPPGAEGGQGDAGQGAAVAEGASGLRPNLDGLAPELRDQVNSILDQFESNATKKFMEHADFRKTWEPYSELGVTDFDPEYLGELLQFSEIFEDEGKFDEWLAQTAQERGLLGQTGGGAEGGEGDEFDVPQTKAELDQYVQQKIEEAVAPIAQQTAQQTEQQQMQQISQQLDQQLDKLLQQDQIDPAQFSAEDREAIFSLALAVDDNDPDPVAKGYLQFKRIRGEGEASLVNGRLNRGNAPEGGGGKAPLDSAQRPKDFKTASAMARERARQFMATR